MASFALVRVQEDDGEGSTNEYVKREQDVNDTETIVCREGFTLKELTGYCVSSAVSRNNHSIAPTHRLLAALLLREVGDTVATSIMLAIAERGGLDGMSGMDYFTEGNQQGSYEELGVSVKRIQ